jgi:hypothetical protein
LQPDALRVAAPSRVSADGTVHLRAEAGQVACALLTELPGGASGLIDLGAVARADPGSVIWYCVLPKGAPACSADLPLGVNQKPTPLSTLTQAGWPGPTDIAVLLQAPASRAATADFSHGSVLADALTVVRVSPLDPAAAAPAVEYHETSAGAYTVTTGPAASGTWLVLKDSYSPRWKLSGLPPGWKAEHVPANGFDNGWLLTGPGAPRLNLRLDFGPQHAVNLIEEVSLTVAAALAVTALSAASPFPIPERRRRRNRKEADV